MKTGKVYLVGAGPGDAGLITVRGLDCLEKADVVLYDRLVNPLLLERVNEEAECIYCGKLPDRHHLRQEAIQQLLIDKAKEGLRVVRLKGGDPGMFGRAGEEAEALVDAGITYEMVPGITAGMAAPLYAGVPVTHRNFSGSFAAVTGHTKAENGQPSPNWKALAEGIDTIAFYMGMRNLETIVEQLTTYGKSPHTPVLTVEWGTTGRQRTIEGTLSTIKEKADEANVKNPAMTLVGEVASLHQHLNWFEKKPLFGQFVWVVKTSSFPGEIAKVLRENGAEVLEAPCYLFNKSSDTLPDEVSHYHSLYFNAFESVSYFFDMLKERQIDIRFLPKNISGSTQRIVDKLAEYGIFTEKQNIQNIDNPDYCLCIGSEESLSGITNLSCYCTHTVIKSSKTRKTLDRLIQDDLINSVVLPSSKAINTVIEELYNAGVSAVEWLSNKTIICYGPHTKEAAIAKGLTVHSTLTSPNSIELVSTLRSDL
ncbi:uroporphyrinogen-III C-methyltransferase [Salibacterium salarium]|uniref:Uroporphyrinogen-III C-methyltransferase n=1 Tax=Salibacterium salarium TaxID=284579 RepID=A0A3R9P4B7_9BACI|nr:uroporphyrinogen-III C-methyltransferase [Salibacterium salarium]RSL32514.1 uroporphyrinogen-III C-methyltransferase [Salibacterium salarium]